MYSERPSVSETVICRAPPATSATGRLASAAAWLRTSPSVCASAARADAALGMQRGDKVAIIGDNRPEWVWSEIAAQAAGGAADVGALLKAALRGLDRS